MTKTRKMLSNWEAPYIQALVKQIETQSKATLTRWAIDYSEHFLLPIWNRHLPDDFRPQHALYGAKEWLEGKKKLPEVKPFILECHAAARDAEGNAAAQAAARAIGQSASTIHSARHCIGLPLYGALAIAYDMLGPGASWDELEQQAAAACGQMLASLETISVDHEPNPAKITWVC